MFEKLTQSANLTGEPQKPSEYKIGVGIQQSYEKQKTGFSIVLC